MRYIQSGTLEKNVLTTALGGIAVFQALLAAGAPWGDLAWGGGNPGVLPPELRVGSVVSSVIWTAAALGVATSSPEAPRRRLLTAVTAVAGVGCVMNLASPSLPERLVWVPVTAGVALLAWRLRQRHLNAAAANPSGSCESPPSQELPPSDEPIPAPADHRPSRP